jgi:hypothetical protein
MDPASVLGHDGQVRPLRRRLLRVPGLAASSLLLLEACTGSASHAQAAGATDAGTVADSTTSGDSPFPTDSAGPIDAPRADSKAPTTDGASTTGPTGCTPITIDSTTKVDSSNADTYGWLDSACKPRTAAMFRNDGVDGLGEAGGYLRRLTYQTGGQQRTCTGTNAHGWNGFGYIVAHYSTGAYDSQQTQGQYAILLAGKHHAIHQYSWSISPGGPVNVTVQWIFETGRDHPLYAITYDATPAGPNVVNADTRAPYGDLGWDNDTLGPVSGVGWGDKYQFRTTGPGPATPASSWDYTAGNVVPYALEWSSTVDAEMGLVATQTWSARKQGGDYGGGLLMSKWGTTDTTLFPADAASPGDMPEWLWPFQLDQYELAFINNSHRVAWGATYGAVGQTSYVTLGQTLSGYPFQSYTVFVVLGAHGASAVAAEASEVAVIAGSTLSASRGTTSLAGPAGIARTDTITYAPAGFDPVYAAWDAHAAQNAATLTLAVPAGSSLANPVFHLHDYALPTAPTSVSFGGRTLTADSEYFATVDSTSSSLWITLNLTVQGAGALAIDP